MSKRTAPQALKDALPAIQAWSDYKKIQYATIPNHVPEWKDYLSDAMPPDFSNEQLIWRPKPEPEKVPFDQQTIPADAWFRKREGMAMYRPTVLSFDGVSLNGTIYFYTKLATEFEHSTDRINWFPCYTLKNT